MSRQDKQFPHRDHRNKGGQLAAPGPSPASVRGGEQAVTAIRRKERLNDLFAQAAGTLDELAERLMLAPSRLQAILGGRVVISDELATHIEEMLGLPASGLDRVSGPASDSPVSVESARPASPSADQQTEGSPLMPTAEQPQAQPAPGAGMSTRRVQAEVNERRRDNLCMLTAQRGAKNTLAALAGFNNSRISLMTAGHKPVSENFAVEIEKVLDLPRHWLDDAHRSDEVPAHVWQRLSVGRPQEGMAPAAAGRPAASRTAVERAPAETAVLESEAPSASALPPSRVRAPEAAPHPASGRAPASALFDKPAGQVGAIAEALAKTVLRMSEADQLSESRAFQILGLLLEDSDQGGF